MPRGGARPNAGRKSKSRELMIERSREAAARAKVTPLEYLLEVLQDTSRPDKDRFAAAVAAAPFVHPRLAAIEGNMNLTHRHEDALAQIESAAKMSRQDEAPHDGEYH